MSNLLQRIDEYMAETMRGDLYDLLSECRTALADKDKTIGFLNARLERYEEPEE